MQSAALALPPHDPERPEGTAPDHRAAVLDDASEWGEFSRELAQQPGMFESYLSISGMYCPGCALTVEQALAGARGVASVQVNGATATARVVWDPQQGRPSDWLRSLRKAGYDGVPAGDMLAAAPRRQAQRLLLWRWLVAGFCMMQVMMYAFPAYTAAPGEITPDVEGLLRWASWILTLPVVLFSCAPFFSSAWRDLRARRIGMDVPVALGIVIAFAASTAATFDPQSVWGREVWYDSVTMFVFFLLSGRLLEQRMRNRTAGALEALMRRLPETVEREGDDGGFEVIALRRLAVGDRIRVKAGEVFPADGVVVDGVSQVDEALLTGESTPLVRHAGNAVVAGSHNLTGPLLVRVERTGSGTRYAEIVALMERASVEKPHWAQVADRIASPFLASVVVAAAAAAAWWWPQGPAHALSIAVAILIVTCPCALSLATPAATLAAAGALARRGVLVRRLEALESAAAVDTVVFDKTGTLTQDRMSVMATTTRPGIEPAHALQLAAALARHSLHPASRAIASAAGTLQHDAYDVGETPGEGVIGKIDGVGADGPLRLRLGSAAFCHAPHGDDSGASQVHLADETGWVASFALDETMRADALRSIGELKQMQFSVQLLSGDHTPAVRRLAWRAGVKWSWGQQSPQDKLEHVQCLQEEGHKVAMVGDGMNDGPVLARADVSVAMGHAVPVAQAKSDFIVLGSQLEAVPLLLRQARRTRRVVHQNLAWAAAYNAVCVPLAILGYMPPWLAGLGMAASSLFVVMNSARLARV